MTNSLNIQKDVENGRKQSRFRYSLLLFAICVIILIFIIGITKYFSFQRSTDLALKKIYLGLIMYAEDNHKYLPDNLGQLHDTGMYMATKIWVIPGSGTKIPVDGNEIREGFTDYILLSPGASLDSIDADSVILATKPRFIQKKGISVLLRDGEVYWYNEVPLKVKSKLENLK